MSNGSRTTALVALAALAQLGVLAITACAWLAPPPSAEFVIGVVAFCQQVVLTVVGFLAGASSPDGPGHPAPPHS